MFLTLKLVTHGLPCCLGALHIKEFLGLMPLGVLNVGQCIAYTKKPYISNNCLGTMPCNLTLRPLSVTNMAQQH